MQTTTADPEDTDSAAPGVDLDWCLTLACHEQPGLVGLRTVLPAGTSVVLGRGSSCVGAGVFEDASISRNHTRVTAMGDQLVVEDLASRNGTSINGVKATEAKLGSSGVIGLGPILLVAHRAPATYRIPEHPRLTGESHALACLLDDIEKVAPHPTNVLICGESGSGKELIAREIHAASRRSGKLCAVNCGTLGGDTLQSEIFGHTRGAFTGADRDRLGLLEAAHRGTLFLDEIGEASPGFQVSLLRFLEDGEVRPLGQNTSRRIDARIVAATHRNIPALIEDGLFREDLHARLSGWVIQVPSLRERIEDIPRLALRFSEDLTGRRQPIHPRLMLALLLYPWPRNVRELRTVVERAVIEARGQALIVPSPSIEAMLRSGRRAAVGASGATPPDRTPCAAAPSKRTRGSVVKPVRENLVAMLTRQRGNIRNLSAQLGVSRNTLYRWFHEYSIELESHR